MKTLILIPCTERKRIIPSEVLRARNLPSGSADDVARAWALRLLEATSFSRHTEIYCGRAYQEAAAAAQTLSTELVVLSAGLGLVRAHDLIPAYGLTVAPGSPDSISRKIRTGRTSADAWWSALKESRAGAVGVNDLMRRTPGTVFLLSLSSSYARLIAEDLSDLSQEEASRLRIFGARIEGHLPKRLAETVMPYDARLNGPDSTIPGTMSDFGSRALRHYSECLARGDVEGASAAEDQADLSALMKGWRYPDIPVRKRMSDAQIIHFILENWQDTGGRSGISHRLLRDSGFACEQGRFRDLFKIAKEQRLENAA